MSEYLLLLVEDESGYATMDAAQTAEVTEAHGAFWGKHGDKVLGGNALQPSAATTSLRPDGAGGMTVTDGPFLETKEVLGGYYLIEAADLDEAIAVARDVPVYFGGVEIRPVRKVG